MRLLKYLYFLTFPNMDSHHCLMTIIFDQEPSEDLSETEITMETAERCIG